MCLLALAVFAMRRRQRHTGGSKSRLPEMGSGDTPRASNAHLALLGRIDVQRTMSLPLSLLLGVGLPRIAAMLSSPRTLFPAEWEIPADQIAICLRADGSRWELGRGSYGVVYKGLMRGECAAPPGTQRAASPPPVRGYTRGGS